MATLALEIHTLLTDENPCNFWKNLLGVGLDAVDLLIPVVTGLGETYKASKYADNVYDADRAYGRADDAYDAYRAGDKLDDVTDVFKACGCFTEGTPVQTAEGERPIEEVAAGAIWCWRGMRRPANRPPVR